MSRILALLSGYALPILGTLLVSALLALGFQTWRVGNLQDDRANLRTALDSAVQANRTNQRTITALTVADAQNSARYQAAIDRAGEAATRIEYLTTQIREQADDDITAIQNTDDFCGLSPMPDDTRMRLDPRRDRDGGSAGDPGAPGADRPGTDPRTDRA